VARLIGDAYIVIYPQTDAFDPVKLEAQLKKQMAAVRPQIPLEPELNDAAVAKVEAELDSLGKDVNVEAALSDSSAEKIRGQLDAISSDISVGAYLSPASMAKLEGQLDAFKDTQLDFTLNPNDLADARASLDAYLKHIDLDLDISPAQLASDKALIDGFLRTGNGIPLYFTLSESELAALKASIDAYMRSAQTDISTIVNPATLAANKAQIDAFFRENDVEVTPVVNPVDLTDVKTEIDTALKDNPVELTPTISPADLTAVKTEIDTALKDNPVELTPTISPADLAALTADTALIKAQLADLQLNISDKTAALIFTTLAGQISTVDDLLEKAGADGSADLDKIAAAVARIQANLEKTASAFGVELIPPSTVTEAEQVASKVDDIEVAATAAGAALDKAFTDSAESLEKVNVDPVTAALTKLLATTASLKTNLSNLRAVVNDSSASTTLKLLQLQANSLGTSLSTALSADDVSTVKLAAFQETLAGIQSGYKEILAASQEEDSELTKQTGLWQSLGITGPGSLIHITDILNASLPEVKLFGGAIGDMYTALLGGEAELPSLASHLTNVATSAHLTAEAAIEITAVWAPAIIAVAAFAAAAAPAVETITKQLENMHVASEGVGQDFKSLATSGESVTAAVKPTVMEAFGEALYAVQNHSSTLATALHTLGAGIDQLGAKAAVAFDSNTTSTFFTQGSKDALALMDSFEQLGSIIGTLMKVVPGYAEVLLGFGNDFLTVGAGAVSAIEPVLAVMLKLHGALFYGGLAGTAAGFIFTNIISGAETASLAVASMAASVLGDENIITKGALGVGSALEDIGTGPVIAGVALLAGALAAIVIYLKASKTAAQGFNASIQALVSSSTLGNLQATLTNGIGQTNAKLVVAESNLQSVNKQFGTLQQAGPAAINPVTGGFSALGNTIGAASDSVKTYQGGLNQLTGQQQTVNGNLQELAKTYGTTLPGALSLANGAQVTSQQLLTKSAANTATLNAQVGGYIAQMAAMTAGAGTLNQALNVLNVTQSDAVTDAQKLTSAYTAWIGIVTGGDSAFTSFEQGQQTLAADLAGGSSAGVKLTVTLGKLSDQYATVGTTMNGTSAAALAARQAFDAQITSATTLYGNLQTMAAASGSTATAQAALAKAGKDLVAQLLPMAAGSQEATAEVYALAQVAGYAGPDSFGSMVKWLGNTKNAESDLNQQQTILTISTANLTAAAKNLSAAVSQEITQAEAAAIAKTQDFAQETLKLAQALNQSQGAASQAVTTYSGQFYTSLIKAGAGATTAKQQVDAFLTQLGASPQAIQQVNAELASLPTSYGAAATAQKNFTTATNNNLNALRSIPATLADTTTGYDQLFSMLEKTDTGLANNASSAALAKNAFITFAEQGLDKTSSEAQKLWSTAQAQQLTMLAGKASTTETTFVNFAKSGLDLTNTQAQQLWSTLRLQYLDTLVTKGKSAESQFIALAKSGLDLDTTSATQLWNTLKQQYLDTLASKANETEAAFVGVAKQFGLNQTAAENLYTSMHQLASGSPYTANINANVSASGEVKAIETSGAAANIVNNALGSLNFSAAGELVKGGGASGQDSVLRMVAPGELIIPTSHAPAHMAQAKREGIPGMASGGLVSVGPSLDSTISKIDPGVEESQTAFAGSEVQAFVNNVKDAAIAALPTTGAQTSTQVQSILEQALKITNTPLSWLPALETLVSKESSGNASAVDPISVDGEHATGLFQTLPSTFSEYAMPGYAAGPTNALDDAIAGIRYIKAEYGTPANITGIGKPGTYEGYSAGGMVPEPVFGYGKYSGMPYSFAENGPEYVGPISGNGAASTGLPPITMYQGQAIVQALQQQNKLLAQMPYSQAQAITQANATGVRRGYFATAG
jgi:Transglycosylase SLT domain